MKKQILSFAIAAAIMGSVAAGCSSQKSTSSSADSIAIKDSLAKDSMSRMNTTPAPADTMKTDTMMKKDTMKTPPKM